MAKTIIDLGMQESSRYEDENLYSEEVKISADKGEVVLDFYSEEEASSDGWIVRVAPETAVRIAEVLLRKARKAGEI